MMNEIEFLGDDSANPLDSVEDVLLDQDWVFTRHDENALSVHITGRHGTYTLGFVWQSAYDAMQMTCEYDLALDRSKQPLIDSALRQINSQLWLGMFEIANDNTSPRFRHTSLLRGLSHETATNSLENLVDIALAECEKHYHVFSLIAHSDSLTDKGLELALRTQAGEA